MFCKCLPHIFDLCQMNIPFGDVKLCKASFALLFWYILQSRSRKEKCLYHWCIYVLCNMFYYFLIKYDISHYQLYIILTINRFILFCLFNILTINIFFNVWCLTNHKFCLSSCCGNIAILCSSEGLFSCQIML